MHKIHLSFKVNDPRQKCLYGVETRFGLVITLDFQLSLQPNETLHKHLQDWSDPQTIWPGNSGADKNRNIPNLCWLCQYRSETVRRAEVDNLSLVFIRYNKLNDNRGTNKWLLTTRKCYKPIKKRRSDAQIRFLSLTINLWARFSHNCPSAWNFQAVDKF